VGVELDPYAVAGIEQQNAGQLYAYRGRDEAGVKLAGNGAKRRLCLSAGTLTSAKESVSRERTFAACEVAVKQMVNHENKTRKRRLNSGRALSKQFVKNIKRALAEVNAGKLSPSKRRLGAFKETFKVADDFDATRTLALGELADVAKAAADRASASIDETPQFVEDSNKRI
jgi:hypothetical protein